MLWIKKTNLWNQARGACLRPYKDLRRRHICLGRRRSTKPGSWNKWTVSYKCLWKKAFLTSSWWIGRAVETTKLRTVLIVAGLTTGLNISLQSIPTCWEHPLATNLALYRSRAPLDLNLCRNNHLQRTIVVLSGLGTRTHVSFSIRAQYSPVIAADHLGSRRADLWDVGIGERTGVVWDERLKGSFGQEFEASKEAGPIHDKRESS